MLVGLVPLETLNLEQQDGVLRITLSRPEVRNAMSVGMLRELDTVLEAAADDTSVRVILLRGAGGNFCAGGDVKDMVDARQAEATAQKDALAEVSRWFGRVIHKVDTAPQAVVAVLEGAVMGGGLGLACVADVALALEDASFRLPETSLGLPPAQIAPYLVQRLGVSRARLLAVTGGRLSGREAAEIGLVHHVFADVEALDRAVEATATQILGCGPTAIATTKRLMRRAYVAVDAAFIDDAALAFAEAVRSAEGTEGTLAFMQRRPPEFGEKQS